MLSWITHASAAKSTDQESLDRCFFVASYSSLSPHEDILTRAMHRLTAREKEVLDLHYFRDLTLRRIAVLLGTSAGALSKSKANLLRKLRACAALPIATAHEI